MSSKLAMQKRKARKKAAANGFIDDFQRWSAADAHDIVYVTMENGKEVKRYTDGIIVGKGWWER